MNNNDYREIIDDRKEQEIEKEEAEKAIEKEQEQEVSGGGELSEADVTEEKDEYEEICYICHRSEHVTGKMVKIANDISICRDCMQRTFDLSLIHI